MARTLERFRAKCEFDPATGCVNWTGAMDRSRDGASKSPVFKDHEGKRVRVRRWAAEHVHGLDCLGATVVGTCGNERCVRHVAAEVVPYVRMNFVLASMGFGDADAIVPVIRNVVEDRSRPEWLG